MKFVKAVAATVLSIAVAIPLSTVAFAADDSKPYVWSDTSINFTLSKNATYSFKMVVHGTHTDPHISVGDSSVIRTEGARHSVENGLDTYYFKIRAIGNPGSATGVYTTLPNQAAVLHSDVAIPYPAGTYKVGSDIPAGQYAVTADYWTNRKAGLGYIELRNREKEGDDIVSNEASVCNRRLVTVKDGQYLQLKNATMIPASDMGRLVNMGSGQYKVGKISDGCDIEPGTYRVSAQHDNKMVFWEVKNGDDSLIDIADNGEVESPSSSSIVPAYKDITLKEGQYLCIDGMDTFYGHDEGKLTKIS